MRKRILTTLCTIAVCSFVLSDTASAQTNHDSAAIKGMPSEDEIVSEYDIPKYKGMKTWMSYKTIKDKKSPQYKLQQLSTTDDNGLRTVNGRYCVAIGTHFNLKVGDYFNLILKNGTLIPCVVGDIKSDRHTDSSNIFTKKSKCMSEFIVDRDCLLAIIKKSGDVSNNSEEWDAPVTQLDAIKGNALKEKAHEQNISGRWSDESETGASLRMAERFVSDNKNSYR